MDPPLDRGMGLLQATATNMLAMIGVGPFLTIPFMVTAMGGPHILYAWMAERRSGPPQGAAREVRSFKHRCGVASWQNPDTTLVLSSGGTAHLYG